MYNSLGEVNFNGKFKGIPLKANQINDSLIEIVVDNKKVSFKKGKKNLVKKELQTIFNKILTKQYKDLDDKYLESEAKKDNIKINKFVDSLDLEFKNIQTMPVKKKATKKAVTKKSVAPRKKITVKKGVTTRKKITVKKVVAPRKKVVRRNIEIDSNRPALKPGRRLSKPQYYKNGALRSEGGKIYYENRLNHADIKQTKKKGQMLGVGSIFDVKIIEDLDSLKKQYLKLAKKYHPDAGGTTIQFQELQNEYERLFKKLLNGSGLSDEAKENEVEIDKEIRNIIDALVNLENLNVELIGKWLWISGETYPVKDTLKSAGLLFIKKAGVPYWVYKGSESAGRGKMSMEEIKNKYGSSKIDLKKTKKISGISINKTKLKSALLKLKKGLNKRMI
jgi:hypothetical protein